MKKNTTFPTIMAGLVSTFCTLSDADMIEIITNSEGRQLAFDMQNDKLVAAHFPGKYENHCIALGVNVSVDADEARQAAYAAMYEELGMTGDIDASVVDPMIEAEHMDDLLAKSDEHKAGLVRDILQNKDWQAWADESEEHQRLASIIENHVKQFC